MKILLLFVREYISFLFKYPLYYFAFKGVQLTTGLSIWWVLILYLLIFFAYGYGDEILDLIWKK